MNCLNLPQLARLQVCTTSQSASAPARVPLAVYHTHRMQSGPLRKPSLACSTRLSLLHNLPATCSRGTLSSTFALPHRAQRKRTVLVIPEPETEKERSSVDFPQEWITPQPSRRPDVQPEFEKLETPMPKRMPGDPEQPDEEEEEEEQKKKKKEDPEKEEEEKEGPDKERTPLPDKE